MTSASGRPAPAFAFGPSSRGLRDSSLRDDRATGPYGRRTNGIGRRTRRLRALAAKSRWNEILPHVSGARRRRWARSKSGCAGARERCRRRCASLGRAASSSGRHWCRCAVRCDAAVQGRARRSNGTPNERSLAPRWGWMAVAFGSLLAARRKSAGERRLFGWERWEVATMQAEPWWPQCCPQCFGSDGLARGE